MRAVDTAIGDLKERPAAPLASSKATAATCKAALAAINRKGTVRDVEGDGAQMILATATGVQQGRLHPPHVMVTSKVVITATLVRPTVKLGVEVTGARHGRIQAGLPLLQRHLLHLPRHRLQRRLREEILPPQLATGIVLEVRAAALSFLQV